MQMYRSITTTHLIDLSYNLAFFTFPAYMDDVNATSVCISNLEDAGGFDLPIRIGGTTQYVLDPTHSRGLS
jgi:hypothetical protein